MGLIIVARMYHKNKSEKANFIIKNFLFKTDLISSIFTRVRHVAATCNYIKQAWRRHRDCLKIRLENADTFFN